MVDDKADWLGLLVAQAVHVAWRARLSGTPELPWWYGEEALKKAEKLLGRFHAG